MKEKTIQEHIIKRMRSAGWYVRKNHGSMYSKAGVPDLICHKEGGTLYIEVKQPGKQATIIQRKEMAELRKYGISSVVATSPEDVRIFWDEPENSIEAAARGCC